MLKTKVIVADAFQVPKGNVFTDMDALSVVVSCPAPLTDRRRAALRKFMLVFGRRALGCGLPAKATGSKTRDGMFGCFGNESQHLPPTLSGSEVMVIDGPIKIALHRSCKERLISCLHEDGVYVSPASAKSGVCIDHQAVTSKPCYERLVGAVIKSCTVGHRCIVHVADMGFKLPLEDGDSMDDVFGQLGALRCLGIDCEVTQCDIAFSFKVGPNRLVQACCGKRRSGPERQGGSLLRGCHVSTHPLHELHKASPNQDARPRGSVQVKKRNWGHRGREVVLLSDDDYEVTESYSEEVGHLFAASSSDRVPTRDRVVVIPSIFHSIKLYSSLAHALLARRNKYPMTLKAMYGAHSRSIQSLQTLISNLSLSAEDAFQVVSKHGVALRLEVSVRPHHEDEFRQNCHYNDILLVTYASVREFCEVHQPGHRAFHHASTRTEVMKLVREADSMLKFRHSGLFKEVYDDRRYWEWLRYHLSLLLITIGICPEFDDKYIKVWLRDHHRYDPHKRGPQPSAPDASAGDRHCGKRALVRHLRRGLRDLQFQQNDIDTLSDFATEFSGKGQFDCYRSLSFQGKHKLANHLWSDLIPHVSRLLTPAGSEGRQDFATGGDIADEDSQSSWPDLDILPHEVLDDQVREAPLPRDPIALAVVSLTKVGCFCCLSWPGLQRTLCSFILLCHEEERLRLPNLPAPTQELLSGCVSGSQLSTQSWGAICQALTHRRCQKRSAKSFIRKLCQRYEFPLSFPEPDLLPQVTVSSPALRNKAVNKALSANFVVQVRPSVVYRLSEDACIFVTPKEKVYSTGNCALSSTPELFSHTSHYQVLARALQTTEEALRRVVHGRVKDLQSMDSLFLSETGGTHPTFEGVSTLQDLEKKHHFLLRMSFALTEFLPSTCEPHVVTTALACYAYRVDFTCYDLVKDTSYLFRCSNGRVVVYTEPTTQVISTGKSQCIKRARDQQSWHLLGLISVPDKRTRTRPASRQRTSHEFSIFSGAGGRLKRSRSSRIIPQRRQVRRPQSFYTAMMRLVKEVDQHYVSSEASNSDHFGLLDMLKELSSVPRDFCGFHESTLNCCDELNRSVGSVTQSLEDKPLSNWSHKVVCPLTCLKFANLTFAVFEYLGRRDKNTYIYSFNQALGQVETVLCSGEYVELLDRRNVLYLYFTPQKTEHYAPSGDTPLPWSDSVLGPFSHLDQPAFLRCLSLLRERLQLRLFTDPALMEAHDFRPGRAQQVVVTTHLTCSSGVGFDGMLQVGVKHHALIVIFPHGHGECWDACIVHHHLQNKDEAMQTLSSFTRGAPAGGQYILHCAEAKETEGNESAFNCILCAYLASLCKSLSSYLRLLALSKTKSDLTRKVKRWVFDELGAKYQARDIPVWLETLGVELADESP